ncbi:MAG: hypothetical protein QM642_02560 [Edaphocola sp.]
MSIVLSICSINYLAQANNLYRSLKKYNPATKMIIGVVDKNTLNVDLSHIEAELVYVEDLHIVGFDEMAKQYTIVELLTAVKPFYLLYLLGRFKEETKFFYFDPDIMLFDSLKKLEDDMEKSDILLTPHICTPIEDNHTPKELHIKKTGLYNLGFLGIKRSENTIQMLEWWANRLRFQCYIDFSRGLFVDQLWMDLVPLYFQDVLVSKYPGYNMAHWNLHERSLSKIGDRYKVNGEDLVFYHFSHYKPSSPKEIAAFHTRFNFETREDLVGIYNNYNEGLEREYFSKLIKTPCFYVRDEASKKRKRAIKNKLRILAPSTVKKMASKYFKKW